MAIKKFLFVKDWHEHQHYRNRRPPWIKLHRALLDDMQYAALPIHAKAILPMVWLIASEDDGKTSADPSVIAFRLRLDTATVADGIDCLVSQGFLSDACGLLARRKHVASAEGEGEGETEGEREIDTTPLTPLAGGDAVTGVDQPQMLADWLAACRDEGVRPIPEDDPIRQWADDAGIPPEYMGLAWRVFCRDWKAKKPQKDWRAVFRNAVKRNWLKLWYIDANGECRLTTVGQQEQRAAGDA